jgi:hypothetical protein
MTEKIRLQMDNLIGSDTAAPKKPPVGKTQK